MPEPLVLLAGLAAAGAFVLLPLWRRAGVQPAADDERDAALLRHRVALEALRDVEADRRAGSLDDAGYAVERAEAEERAVATRAALEGSAASELAAVPEPRRGRTAAVAVAGLIGVALLVGSALPSTGIANQTTVNEQLAAAEAAETARRERINELLAALADDPRQPETLSELADAYLGGSTRDDLVRAAVALRLLVELEPDRADAYERIVAAYLRAGDYGNARDALNAYAERGSADPVEVAFLDGLIALRGEQDAGAAVAAFDRFLDLAPEDPRAEMVRGLRQEAAGDR